MEGRRDWWRGSERGGDTALSGNAGEERRGKQRRAEVNRGLHTQTHTITPTAVNTFSRRPRFTSYSVQYQQIRFHQLQKKETINISTCTYRNLRI